MTPPSAPLVLPDFVSLALEERRKYYGRDPNLQENPSCWTCGENKPDTTMLLCSRCKILPYCSADCQKAGYAEHKKSCKKLEKLVRQMDEEAESLRAGQFGLIGFGPPENAFEEHVGSFWGIFETRDYMRARLAVVEAMEKMNWHVESKRGWNNVAAHIQDMLRLCASDNLGLRYRFPFVLINLNRDDDAYCFIRYWMEDYNSHCEERDRNHARSKEGDWLYPQEEGARYGDILEQCPDEQNNYKYESLALLVASVVIKMRVVAAQDAKRLREDSDFDPEVLETQRNMLLKLLDIIDRNNKTMLPALLHPGPLRRGPRPDFHTPGHPSEARMVLDDACRPWARIPGSKELLEARFGTSIPAYDTNMRM